MIDAKYIFNCSLDIKIVAKYSMNYHELQLHTNVVVYLHKILLNSKSKYFKFSIYTQIYNTQQQYTYV